MTFLYLLSACDRNFSSQNVTKRCSRSFAINWIALIKNICITVEQNPDTLSYVKAFSPPFPLPIYRATGTLELIRDFLRLVIP